MPSSYTTNIAIEKPAKGEKDQTWGAVVNRNMDIVDRLTSQIGEIALTGTSYTLAVSSLGVLSDGHYSMVRFTGSPGGTCTVTVSPNSVQRIYTVINNSDETVTLAQGSGGTVDIVSGAAKLVYCDGAGSGAAVVDVSALINPSDISAGDVSISGTLTLGGTDVTSTAAELNLLDGVTWTLTDFNTLTATAAELNILDGVTASTAEINVLDGVTATSAEINVLDGVTATVTELNLLDGVTGKTGADNVLVTGTAGTDGQFAQWNADGDMVGADIATLPEADWEAGTDTTEAIVSPAKVKAAIEALTPAADDPIGVGQSWQTVSLSSGSARQNTTGRPIQMAVTVQSFGVPDFDVYSPSSSNIQVSSDGSTWITVGRTDASTSDTDYTTVTAIIPDNHYYRYNGVAAYVAELR